MVSVLRLLLAAAHLGAASLPCLPEADLRPGTDRASELRASCECGCEGTAPATQSTQLAAALLPVASQPTPVRGAALAPASPLPAPGADARIPEPVPRNA